MYGNRGGSGGFRGPQRSTAPVNVGDELDVKIEAVGEKGDGIAKKDGFVLFVPGVREGDEVRIRVTRVLRKVGFAETIGGSKKAAKKEPEEEPEDEISEDELEAKASEDFGDEEEKKGEEEPAEEATEEEPAEEATEEEPAEEATEEEPAEEEPEEQPEKKKKKADEDEEEINDMLEGDEE